MRYVCASADYYDVQYEQRILSGNSDVEGLHCSGRSVFPRNRKAAQNKEGDKHEQCKTFFSNNIGVGGSSDCTSGGCLCTENLRLTGKPDKPAPFLPA